jgi:glutaredoxin
MLNSEMLSGLTGKLRSLAHQQLEAREADRPLVRRLRDVVSTVNDLLGKPIRPDGVGQAPVGPGAGPVGVPTPVREQAPVVVYFDGKDQRTKTKVEELLNAREIKFRLLDVSNDEAERSWVITAAKSEEFPIVVIAGTPVGGFHELMQLDVTGQLKKRVFGS